MLNLTHYTKDHRLELEKLFNSQEWQRAISSGLIEEVRSEKIEPNEARNFIDTVVKQLLEFNEGRVRRLVDQGCRDEDYLFSELSQWPDSLEGRNPVISFLGVNVTAGCNFDPKCIYCNQPYVESSVSLDEWKRVVKEVTTDRSKEGPYIYVTGGEPLVLGEDIWGDNGLVRYATERGARVNVNTNATLITPEVALRFIKSGLAILHISLDTPDKDLQNFLCGGEHYDDILRGIYNVQLARDIIGVAYPIIHTNCVLTNRNLDLLPQLFGFILEKHKQTAEKDDPFYNDLFPHIIPVGGRSNDWLRPSEDEFRRFYGEVWSEVCQIWDKYQDEFRIPEEKRGALFGYFSNPFRRVEHEGGLEAYARTSAEGRYGELALSKHCYVAPTQSSFTPDGYQFRCGSHAIHRSLPIGNIRERGVFDNIRAGISGLDDLPDVDECYGCALATLYINQSVESKLEEIIKSMLMNGK